MAGNDMYTYMYVDFGREKGNYPPDRARGFSGNSNVASWVVRPVNESGYIIRQYESHYHGPLVEAAIDDGGTSLFPAGLSVCKYCTVASIHTASDFCSSINRPFTLEMWIKPRKWVPGALPYEYSLCEIGNARYVSLYGEPRYPETHVQNSFALTATVTSTANSELHFTLSVTKTPDIARGEATLQFTRGSIVVPAAVMYGETHMVATAWHHLAVVRGYGGNNASWAIFWDGAVVGSVWGNAAINNVAATGYVGKKSTSATALRFYIGGMGYLLNTSGYCGPIDEVRWQCNNAQYQSSFSPPTSKFAAPVGPGTVIWGFDLDLDMSFKGGGRVFTMIPRVSRESSRLSFFPSATLLDSSDWSGIGIVLDSDLRQGVCSYQISNGNNGSIIPGHTTGNFTIEMGIASVTDAILAMIPCTSTHHVYLWVDVDKIGGHWVAEWRINEGDVSSNATAVIATSIWYNTSNHIAIIKGWGGDSNKYAFVVNGSCVDTLTYSGTTCLALATVLHIPYSDGEYYDSKFDMFRISKGARWTEAFTPPYKYNAHYPYRGVKPNDIGATRFKFINGVKVLNIGKVLGA